MDESNSRARSNALAEIDRLARYFQLSLFAGFVIEAALLCGLLLMMDFKNPTHRIMVVGYVGSYSIVIMAIVALGAHVSRVGQRILRALEATGANLDRR